MDTEILMPKHHINVVLEDEEGDGRIIQTPI